MRNNYLKFISELSKIFHKKFGNIWWYSLIHEKNTTKTNTYHNLVKNIYPIIPKFIILKSFYNAIKKYFIFLVRYILFNFNSKKFSKNNIRNIAVSYYGNYLDHIIKNDSFIKIILPQKNDYKKILKDKNNIVIDRFINWYDFIIVFFQYINSILNFLLLNSLLKEAMNDFGFKWFCRDWNYRDNYYDFFKEDTWRSFVGDVLIEGLFYERAFRNLHKSFLEARKIYYVYEGQAWEKALCIAFKNKAEIHAILCSTPGINIMTYFYDKEEVKIMPFPDKIGVLGQITYDIFKEYYGDRCYISGAGRFDYLKEVIKKEYEKDNLITVISPSNNDQNKELIKFVDRYNFRNCELFFKVHPDNNKQIDNINLNSILEKSKFVVALDSSVCLEALAYGCIIIIPELKSYVNMSPLMQIGDSLYYKDFQENMIVNIKENKKFIEKYFKFNKKG